MNLNNKKIYILTNGCPENRIESARVQKFFLANNCIISSDLKDADIIFFNACGQSSSSSITLIKQIKTRKKKSAELIVFGCFPKIGKKGYGEIYQGPIIGSNEIEKFDELFPLAVKIKDVKANFLFPHTSSQNRSRIPSFSRILEPLELIRKLRRQFICNNYKQLKSIVTLHGPDTFNIQICNGCLSSCSYCSHVFARGRLKSKPVQEILEEFDQGLNEGYRQFGLIGTDLSAYGKDFGGNLVSLLWQLVKRPGYYKIKLRNLNPKNLLDMAPEFVEVLKSGKITYMESAFQSGNNRVLELMKRGYKIEDYKEAIQKIRQIAPELEIRTQVIVNFPSETEDEFQDSVRLLDEVRFDFIEIYDFRPEPNTKAAKLEGIIPRKVASRRYHELSMKIYSKIKKQYSG